MKHHSKPAELVDGLVDLLERDFSSGSLVPASCHMAARIPRSWWERALLSPARDFLQRPGKEFRARLVATCWALAGGQPDALPDELPLVVELLHAGSLIVDDIEDQSDSRRGGPALHRVYGTPVALNTGNWLYFWSLVVMARNLPADAQATMQARASQTLMHCHQGQALDLTSRVCDLPQADIPAAVEVSTGLKTGALMEFAAVLGAQAAGASPASCHELGRFGYRLGVGLQMLDDLGGLLAPSRRRKAQEDMRLCRLTWPWAWLAQDCEPWRFAGWQQRSRRAADAAGSDDTPSLDGLDELNELIEAMAGTVSSTGRAHISQDLEGALDDLRHALGPSPHLAEIQREIRRLEQSYG